MRKAHHVSTLAGVALLVISVVAFAWAAHGYLRGAASAPSPSTLAATPAATPSSAATPAPRPDLAGLTLSARAALLIDDAGTVLYAANPDEPLPPASTAKIVTALVVARYARPEEIVTIQPGDESDPSESTMGLRAGDTVTVHDLLVGMLLPSGDDAARVLARVVGERIPGDQPPRERFLAEMNALAAQLGMRDSHFTDPAGDDAPGQAVTARDLALAARRLLAEPSLLPIVATREARVRVGGPNARTLTLTNTNELLATEGVFGVKTGTTPAAGQCLVVAYQHAGRIEIAVVLGSQDRYADARALLGLPAAP